MWSPVDYSGGVPLLKYRVYYDIGQTGTFASDDITDLFSLTWTKTGLTTGALVDIQISAFNSIGESEVSPLRTFTVASAPAAPNAPTRTKVVASQVDETVSATISWTEPASNGAEILGFKVYAKTASTSDLFEVVYDGS